MKEKVEDHNQARRMAEMIENMRHVFNLSLSDYAHVLFASATLYMSLANQDAVGQDKNE